MLANIIRCFAQNYEMHDQQPDIKMLEKRSKQQKKRN